MADLNVTDGDRERARKWLSGNFDYDLADDNGREGFEDDVQLLAAEFAKVRAVAIEASIERAEQACRYALKHQEFSADDAEYRKTWEVAASVCEKAIRANVERHVSEDCAAAIRQAIK